MLRSGELVNVLLMGTLSSSKVDQNYCIHPISAASTTVAPVTQEDSSTHLIELRKEKEEPSKKSNYKLKKPFTACFLTISDRVSYSINLLFIAYFSQYCRRVLGYTSMKVDQRCADL